MKVKELKSALENLDDDQEVYMFFKSPDGKTNFTSDITGAYEGAVYNEYGALVRGVLIMKETK